MSILTLSVAHLLLKNNPLFQSNLLTQIINLSDKNAKLRIDQSIHSNLTSSTRAFFPKRCLYLFTIFFYSLEDIVDTENLNLIKMDQKSTDYITYQRNKFKHITQMTI